MDLDYSKAGNTKDIVTTLVNLDQYEIDGSFLVSQAIDSIGNKEIRDRLIDIKKDYEAREKKIGDLIHFYGGEVPTHSRDFKGFFMQGYASMRGLFSDQGVLNALSTNTKYILKAYEKALDSSLPEDLKEEVRQLFEEAKKDADYIERQL